MQGSARDKKWIWGTPREEYLFDLGLRKWRGRESYLLSRQNVIKPKLMENKLDSKRNLFTCSLDEACLTLGYIVVCKEVARCQFVKKTRFKARLFHVFKATL